MLLFTSVRDNILIVHWLKLFFFLDFLIYVFFLIYIKYKLRKKRGAEQEVSPLSIAPDPDPDPDPNPDPYPYEYGYGYGYGCGANEVRRESGKKE